MSIDGVPALPPTGDAVPGRPRWVKRLTIANLAFLAISLVIAIAMSSGLDGVGLAIFFFPQIAGTAAWPFLGLSIIFVTLLISAIVALASRKGTTWGARFYATLTLCGFIVNCLCLIAPFAVFALASF